VGAVTITRGVAVILALNGGTVAVLAEGGEAINDVVGLDPGTGTPESGALLNVIDGMLLLDEGVSMTPESGATVPENGGVTKLVVV
jgi:hypothetical protein